jgi:hypothetical protein
VVRTDQVSRNVVQYKYLVGKLEGKRPVGKPICRWEVKFKRDFKGIGCVDIVANRPVAKR